MPSISLRDPLRLSHSFRFPLQSALARREVLIGALWLLVPVIGWLLNMGHRIAMVRRMQDGQEAWPSWQGYPQLLRDGTLTFLGMVLYTSPGIALVCAGWFWSLPWLIAVGALLFAAAVFAIPGYMTHYCWTGDPREIFNPFRALVRVRQGGRAYLRAWGIALAALGLSFVGLAGLGVGFLVTSVWFWQVAGFSFAVVFSQAALDLPRKRHSF
jgi:hypothetical protein